MGFDLENKPRKMARGVPYRRVSTDEQAAGGIGLEAQHHAIAQYAERAGLDLVEGFADEGISGAAPLDHRPGILAALADLRPGDVLIVAKRDRLGRDPVLVAMIEAGAIRRGARVASAAGEGTEGDDPTSILMRRIIDAFAEFERLLIKSRTRAAIDSLRRRNRRAGTIPYGSAAIDDGKPTKTSGGPGLIVEDPAEVRTIGRILDLWDNGASPRRIGRILDDEGLATRSGRPWHHSTIRRIVAARRVPRGGLIDAQG